MRIMRQADYSTTELQRQFVPLYQKWGLSIIPLRFKEKTPAVQWQKYQQVTPQVGELLQWFSSDSPKNVGIVCGSVSGNLVVLDFDNEDLWAGCIRYCDEHGIDIYQTPQVRTGRGMHIWIRLCNLPRLSIDSDPDQAITTAMLRLISEKE